MSHNTWRKQLRTDLQSSINKVKNLQNELRNKADSLDEKLSEMVNGEILDAEKCIDILNESVNKLIEIEKLLKEIK